MYLDLSIKNTKIITFFVLQSEGTVKMISIF